MGEAKRSRTAQGVAAERALLADWGVIDDPHARGMLGPSMAAVVRLVPGRAGPLRSRSVTLAGLAARVRWFDAQVVAASSEAGLGQVVTIGAGYDSRAWRLRSDHVRFYELDHRPTQLDKRRRAPGPGPTYVEHDLRDPGAHAALVAHGLDPARPALFVVEGVTMYLSEDIVRDRLRELAAASAPGSRLAVDFFPPPASGASNHRRQLLLQRLARAGSGEGFRLAVDRDRAVELVEASGWQVTEATSLRDAALALVPPGSGLPIASVNGHKTLVAAERS